MKIAAFDLSLTATGWARSLDSAPTLGAAWESGVLKSKHKGAARLWDLLNQIVRIGRVADLVILEGYAHAASYQAHQMGELGGVVRLGFLQAKVPVVVVPPTKLKAFATGTGGGKKERIFAECIRRLGYEGHSEDEADAIWLLQMGLHHYRLPGEVKLPKAQTERLADVKWPQIETVH